MSKPLSHVEYRDMWKNEHPKAAVPAAIAHHPELVDLSWHNDICPSFTTEAFINAAIPEDVRCDVRLWVDYVNTDDREYGAEVPRFRVCSDVEDASYFESETDIEGAIAKLKEVTERMIAEARS